MNRVEDTSAARLTPARQNLSSLRRAAESDPSLVRTFGLCLGPGEITPPQAAPWHHLITAPQGRALVRTTAAIFPLVTGSGAWIPSGVPYSIELAGAGEIRLLYLRPEVSARREPAMLHIPALLRELIARTTSIGALDGRIAAQRRLAGVIADEIAAVREMKLHIPLPPSGRAREAADILLADAERATSIDDVARRCGISRRTLERAFAREVGVGVAHWLRRVRFADGLYALRAGAPVTAAAFEAGYAGPSAFIAAFKREFRTTPRGYCR